MTTPNTQSDESPKNPDPDIIGAEEAAKLLGVHRTSLYEAAKRGQVPCGRVGRRFIFDRDELIRWIRTPVAER